MGRFFLDYLMAVGLTVIATLYLVVFAWRRREIRGALSFALAMLAIVDAANMYGLLAIIPDPTLAFIWTRLRFAGLAAIPVLICVFILNYTNRAAWLSHKVGWILWAIPLVTQFTV